MNIANQTSTSPSMTFTRINPFDGSTASTSQAFTTDDAKAAVESAAAAFHEWSTLGPHARRRVLLTAADILESRAKDLIRINMAETGATRAWVGFNVAVGAKMLREAASMTTQITGEVIPSEKRDTLSMAIRQPAGVCLGIAPWNAAIILAVRAVAMPLACGNTVILKASESSPATHQMIGEIIQQAGVPEGAISVVTNAPEDAASIVECLIREPAIKRVNFTGSTRVGRIIARLCADELKPGLLELGGKSPFIVLEDADIDQAVNGAAFSAFMNMGQICMSTERLIVVDAVADQFVSKLTKKAMKLTAGDPSEHHVLGPLVDQHAAERLNALVQDATDKGATFISAAMSSGAVVPAGLLDGVTSDMRIYDEESFGPIKPIIRVSDTEEAIRVANDTEYGLAAALYTSDVKNALALASRIQSGICHINGPTVADEPQVPFGGVNASGYGRFGGKAAISEFTDLRWITVEDPGQGYPF